MVTTVSLKDALLDSAREVFETMVFMALEDSGDDTTSLGDTTLLGSITFKGRLEGCLGVCCDEVCARTIAANMLGMPSPDELRENDISDAMGEIANMVMGAVKARIQNEVGNIEVSIPSVVQGRELRMGRQLPNIPAPGPEGRCASALRVGAVGNPNSLGEGAGQVKVRVNVEEQYRAEFSLLYRDGGTS